MEEMSTKKKAEKKKAATRGKAWGEDEVRVLISAWKAASLRIMPVGLTAKMRSQAIYAEYLGRLASKKAEETGEVLLVVEDFKASCASEGPEGGLDVCDKTFRPRSQRAIEDEVASLKQSYTLISDHNNGTLVGSTGRPEWFEMSKEERAAVLKKWKRVALSSACFELMADSFEDDPSVALLVGGIALGSQKRSCEETSEPGSAQKKKKTSDLAASMQTIMDGAVESMRAIASEDRNRFIDHQKEENEKNRDLLRSLFGRD